MEKRRNYQQFCELARALDRVGERWTLLIVRNLLLGPKRYSDLLEELPGITTNLLAARLREMGKLGLVTKRAAPSPVRATLYELGPHGRALEPALMELARWGGRFMDGAHAGDTANIGWAFLSLKRRYRGGLRLVAEIAVDGRCFELAFDESYLSVTEGAAARPDVSVRGSLDTVRLWLFRASDPLALRERGELVVEGSETAFRTLVTAFLPREMSSEQVRAQGAAHGDAG